MPVNVFISHSWQYSEHYDKLEEWIFKKEWSLRGRRIYFENISVPKDDPIHTSGSDRALDVAIRERILNSDIIIIPTGMYVNYSRWIKKEIKGAKDYDKPILAVNLWGREKKSSIVCNAADKMVGWSAKSVVGGIVELFIRSGSGG